MTKRPWKSLETSLPVDSTASTSHHPNNGSNKRIVIGDKSHNYCYLHRRNNPLNPELSESYPFLHLEHKKICEDELSEEELDKLLDFLLFFQSSSTRIRNAALSGVLAQCCIPNLSFAHGQIQNILNVDIVGSLPCELAVLVLSYCDSQTICRAAQVSKRWNSIAYADQLWHRMCEQHIDKKCTKCGWELPLMMPKKRPASCSSSKDSIASGSYGGCKSTSSTAATSTATATVKTWRTVYKERYVVEKNWRKGQFKSFYLPVVFFQDTQQQEDEELLRGEFEQDRVKLDGNEAILTNDQMTKIQIWNLKLKKLMVEISLDKSGGGTSSKIGLITQNSKTIAIVNTSRNAIDLWDKVTGKFISTLRLNNPIDQIASIFMNDKFIAVNTPSGPIMYIWNFQNMSCHRVDIFDNENQRPIRLSKGPCDTEIYILDNRSKIHLLNLEIVRIKSSIKCPGNPDEFFWKSNMFALLDDDDDHETRKIRFYDSSSMEPMGMHVACGDLASSYRYNSSKLCCLDYSTSSLTVYDIPSRNRLFRIEMERSDDVIEDFDVSDTFIVLKFASGFFVYDFGSSTIV